MSADPAFRLSTYLSLGLACAALGVAESPILAEVGGFAVVVIVAIAVVYRLETRVELLSVTAANNLGIAIALAGAGWAAVRVVREVRAGEFASVGWAVFVVLLLVPVLMALLVALLLRREKSADVYWYLHAGALAAVVFAAALSRRPREVALVAAYAGVAVWGLARFALARGGAAPAVRARAGLAGAAALAAGAAAAAAPAFGLTPASPFEKWDVGPGRIDVGFSSTQTVDLTRTGRLGGGDDVAFTVHAEQAGRSKDDLRPDTRWRGQLLSHYQNGTWRREPTLHLPWIKHEELAAKDPHWRPPDLGPGAYQLRFTVPARFRTPFLAEPVVWAPGQPSPVADVFAPPVPPRPWLPLSDGAFLPNPTRADLSPTLLYVQYTAPLADPDLGVGFTVTHPADPSLTDNPVPAVKGYASRRLADLVRAGKLPPAAGSLDPVRLRPPPDQHEAIARAFSQHLSDDPAFAYTTALVRPRPDLDPVEEFLEHSKAGHCERFASALVLMLRSQGIPAALVLGFKGHEPAGNGDYLVRQDMAHTWATALVTGPDGRSYWLSLDPSPATAVAGGTGPAATGWEWAWDHLLDASPEERLRALAVLAAHPAAIGVGAALAALAALGWWARRLRSNSVAAGRASPALAPLLVVLAKAGFVPAAGETPREFAARVSAALAAHPGTAAVAGVPPAWVEGYYGERFGGAPAADRAADLAALRAALAANPPGIPR